MIQSGLKSGERVIVDGLQKVQPGSARSKPPGRRTTLTPRFFIDRPVFSWVIALAILFAGGIALRSLPIEQYPTIAPPSLTICRRLSGRRRVRARHQRHAADRAGAQRRRGLPVHVVVEPVERHGVHRA